MKRIIRTLAVATSCLVGGLACAKKPAPASCPEGVRLEGPSQPSKLQVVERVATACPRSSTTLLLLASYFLETKDDNAALASLDRAFELDVDWSPVRRHEAALMRAALTARLRPAPVVPQEAAYVLHAAPTALGEGASAQTMSIPGVTSGPGSIYGPALEASVTGMFNTWTQWVTIASDLALNNGAGGEAWIPPAGTAPRPFMEIVRAAPDASSPKRTQPSLVGPDCSPEARARRAANRKNDCYKEHRAVIDDQFWRCHYACPKKDPRQFIVCDEACVKTWTAADDSILAYCKSSDAETDECDLFCATCGPDVIAGAQIAKRILNAR